MKYIVIFLTLLTVTASITALFAISIFFMFVLKYVFDKITYIDLSCEPFQEGDDEEDDYELDGQKESP